MGAVKEGTSDTSNILAPVPDGFQLEGTQESTRSIHSSRIIHPLPKNERRRAAQNQGRELRVTNPRWSQTTGWNGRGEHSRTPQQTENSHDIKYNPYLLDIVYMYIALYKKDDIVAISKGKADESWSMVALLTIANNNNFRFFTWHFIFLFLNTWDKKAKSTQTTCKLGTNFQSYRAYRSHTRYRTTD